MNDDKLDSPKAIKAFLGGTDKLKFSVPKSNRNVVNHVLMVNLVIFALIPFIKAIRIKKKVFTISMRLMR